MKKILFIPTWRCNLRCSYCEYRTQDHCGTGYTAMVFGKPWKIARELAWDEWLAALDRFKPYHLEVTGGEPTLYPDLSKLIDGMPTGCTWSITSNSVNVEPAMSLNINQCIGWAASYHHGSLRSFVANLVKVRSKRINPKVTIVITPENFEDARKAIATLRREGFSINVHPVYRPVNVWPGHEDIWNKVHALEGVNVIKTIEEGRFSYCSAGTDYFVALPDGKVARCLSAVATGSYTCDIQGFQLFERQHPCSISCMFPCDIERPKEGK